MDLQCLARRCVNFIRHIGCCLDEIEIRFPLQTLLDNLHVQQAEKSTTKSKSEGIASFRFKLKTGIIDGQFLQCIAEFLKIFSVRRVESAVDHPFRCLISGQRLSGCITRNANRVANMNVSKLLDIADQISNLPGLKFFSRLPLWHKVAQFQHFMF